MNPEQGMSKEEGRGMSEEMATKNAKNHKAARGRNPRKAKRHAFVRAL
jgi:hypothetical protein